MLPAPTTPTRIRSWLIKFSFADGAKLAEFSLQSACRDMDGPNPPALFPFEGRGRRSGPNPPAPFPPREGGERHPSPPRGGAEGEVGRVFPRTGVMHG